MEDRNKEEMQEIYYEASELLVKLTELNSKWLRVRDLINDHNYTHLNLFNEQSKTLDNLFSAEQQIRRMLNHYSSGGE